MQVPSINPLYKGPMVISTYAYKRKSKDSIFGKFIKRYFTIDLTHLTIEYKCKQKSKTVRCKYDLKNINKVCGECEGKGPWPFGITIMTNERVFSLYLQNSLDYDMWIDAFSCVECIAKKPIMRK